MLWVRTSDLCRVKALRAFLMRPGVYACVRYIRRFRLIEGLRMPAVFGSVLVRLLHGCCTYLSTLTVRLRDRCGLLMNSELAETINTGPCYPQPDSGYRTATPFAS